MSFRRRAPLQRFFTTYRDRSLLVHRGLAPNGWNAYCAKAAARPRCISTWG